MNKDFYIERENWDGSYYELAIELQASHDEMRLEKALQALWSYPKLSGHWLSKENYGQAPDVFNLVDEFRGTENNSFIHVYGLFSIPEIDRQVGCLSIIVREQEGSDWLDFCFPTAMLKSVFPVKKPLLREQNPWLTTVDKYLLEMANIVYQQTPYDLAFIGDEVSGLVNRASIIEKGIENEVKFYNMAQNKVLISPAFWDEVSLDKNYEVMSSGLRWATFAQQ